MQTWKWLYNPDNPFTWRLIIRVVIKAALLFVVLNVAFALLDPLPTLGRFSAYNHLFKGRERLPYGENPDASYNLSLFQLDAMFASHTVTQDKAANEYRVLLIGDSATWGIQLKPGDTLAGQINRGDYHTADGKRVRAYNLGYPTMSLTKDLLLLDYAMDYQPDLIIWLFTLESFGQDAQLDTAIVQHNPGPVRHLIERYGLHQDTDDSRFVDPSTWDKTIIGRRRDLADMMRLQLYGIPWSQTGIDQEYGGYTPLSVDLSDNDIWQGFRPGDLTADDLAFDVIAAGVQRVGDTPILLVNEPMFISTGANSDIRYNFFYPRWAYDFYRDTLHQQSDSHQWNLLDLWDAIPNTACYTDSPVHLTPACSADFARLLGPAIIDQP